MSVIDATKFWPKPEEQEKDPTLTDEQCLEFAREALLMIANRSAVLAAIAGRLKPTAIDATLFADRTQRQAAMLLGELK